MVHRKVVNKKIMLYGELCYVSWFGSSFYVSTLVSLQKLQVLPLGHFAKPWTFRTWHRDTRKCGNNFQLLLLFFGQRQTIFSTSKVSPFSRANIMTFSRRPPWLRTVDGSQIRLTRGMGFKHNNRGTVIIYWGVCLHPVIVGSYCPQPWQTNINWSYVLEAYRL